MLLCARIYLIPCSRQSNKVSFQSYVATLPWIASMLKEPSSQGAEIVCQGVIMIGIHCFSLLNIEIMKLTLTQKLRLLQSLYFTQCGKIVR